ncbi:MazG-like nucleoside triphosphate pyrophosphohydrolase [Pseudomonas syringae pv. primulae]|uniref:MazG-like nucleoside triphosphate pyrophosphohydrolase n=2 Tax=Pseudomonas TaxID=286 RepID=A0A0P9XSU1_9PSED|nr:MazG-like nucleoside triphosphate pyrophosphohydrolase [Pseudomonas syringae pv. primulae]
MNKPKSPLACQPVPPEAMRLQESMMNLDELTQRLHRIRDQNDWKQFHSPKNLAMAASVEMSELVEIFQWLREDQSRELSSEQLAHAGQEVGDIVLYLLLLCSELGLNMDEVVRSKLTDSERRFAK